MNIIFPLAARPRSFPGALAGGRLLLGIFFLWFLLLSAATAEYSLVIRPGFLGDPYLTTNTAGQISLVINPELFNTNSGYPDYQDKVAALAALDHSTPQGWRTFLGTGSSIISSTREAANRLLAGPTSQNDHFAQSHSETDAIPFSSLIQRWLLFILVSLFLLRRIWRFFREVDDDDDFANHLATLAVAHRWVFPVYLGLLLTVAVAEFKQVGNPFFSVSLLLLASALRGYYCEGDFADFPKLQKLHLGLSLALVALGWTIGTGNFLGDLKPWFEGHGLRNVILDWLILAVSTRGLKSCLHGPDLSQQREYVAALLLSFLAIGLVGGTVGAGVWFRLGWHDHLWNGCLAGALFACFLLSVALFASKNPVFLNVVGGTVVDMFLPRFFGQKTQRSRHLPSLLLLRHWRDHGEVDKAWQAARTHLFGEPRALPLWLFAIETAILHRRRPDDAIQILERLRDAEAFSYDHRAVAVAETREWMASAGYYFDNARFKIEPPALLPTGLADQVEDLCQAGKAGEAAAKLRAVLAEDSLNEAAFIQLIRVYCQDLKNRRGAHRLIADAADTFSPKLLAYLNRTVDEWIQMPSRSTVQRKGWLAWLLPPKTNRPKPEKLTITSPPITQKPSPAGRLDPMESYLERVRESHGAPPDTSAIFDRAEKLLTERRLGTAVELIKQQAEAAPDNFDLWLRYAEAHGHHCGDPAAAEKIIRQMERSGQFKKAQMKKAHTRLKKWWKQHASHENHF